MSDLVEHRIASLTVFRRNATTLTEWVRHSGGRVWITKHGRSVAAVVPMYQCERLEEWEMRSLAAERRRMELAYAKWKAVKAKDLDTYEQLEAEYRGFERRMDRWGKVEGGIL